MVVVVELAWGPPVSMEEDVMARCAATARVLLGAFSYGSWWSRWLSVACCHRWMKMGCSSLTLQSGVGASNCTEQKLCSALQVPAMSTPLGVDYLVEGIIVVILSSPWRSSGRLPLRHPSWLLGSRSVGRCSWP
jgi:hypothetical protein